jgi:hypothetical protein
MEMLAGTETEGREIIAAPNTKSARTRIERLIAALEQSDPTGALSLPDLVDALLSERAVKKWRRIARDRSAQRLQRSK